MSESSHADDIFSNYDTFKSFIQCSNAVFYTYGWESLKKVENDVASNEFERFAKIM